MNYKVITLIVFLSGFFSCNKRVTHSFLNKCYEKHKSGEQYCHTSLEELKKYMPKHTLLYYIGSSDNFDHFIFYDNKKTKRIIQFKVPESNFNISKKKPLNQEHSHDDPFYLKDY